METMSDIEACRERANRLELLKIVESTITEDGTVEPLEGLHLYRVSKQIEPVAGLSVPGFCVVLQGSKEIVLGDKSYAYDPDHFLLATVELPAVGKIQVASPTSPYLGMRLDLDSALVGSAMVDADIPAPKTQTDAKAIVVSSLNSALLDATLRLLRLTGSPSEARVFAPLVKREIVLRLLMGEQGHRLRHLATLDGYSHRIARAIDRLRSEFNKPLKVEEIAKEFGMSTSGFHHHFKTVTDTSPMQFQRQIRLQEARRLMLSEELDAAGAGYRVGYEDPSHFSREYKKLFGTSPVRDVERLRRLAVSG